MPFEFKLTRRVEFVETDMAGIMHFSNFFLLMEATESAFFRHLGFSLCPQASSEGMGWPRVHVECDFKHPLYFEDEVEVHLLVDEKRAKSLTYVFVFRKLNQAPALQVARGRVVAVCAARDEPGGKISTVPIPPLIANAIDVAPRDLMESLPPLRT
ncbi:MAG TPA: thioesterase family protein [Acidobacteriota bacterium]|nr:thioesterase family protein [Acidobacteriota bacterium]